jgi:hypothetical protein
MPLTISCYMLPSSQNLRWYLENQGENPGCAKKTDWWFQPLWKIWKPVGMMKFPTEWKNTIYVPNHQSEHLKWKWTFQLVFVLVWLSVSSETSISDRLWYHGCSYMIRSMLHFHFIAHHCQSIVRNQERLKHPVQLKKDGERSLENHSS